ncbi:MAG: hypothetical protein D6678_01715 [Zetaproteobacteria bacterium]|nr:MAG: hypothetical protein D6678_01715 [Zetaproteobacteria bacterium]
MTGVWALIRLSLRELAWQRAYLLLVVAAMLFPWLLLIPTALFLLDLGKVLVDMLFAIEHVLLSCFVFFLASPLLSRDLDQRLCHLWLTMPLSRAAYLVARFLGTVLALLPLLCLFLVMAWMAGQLAAHLWPAYASTLHGAHMLVGGMLLVLPYVALLGLFYFIACASSGAAEALVFLLGGWLLSWAIPPVLQALRQAEVAAKTSPWIAQLIRALDFVVPDLSSARLALEVAHGQWPELHLLLPYMVEHLAYAVSGLLLAMLVFARRDLG